jgi:hypothetical protein
MTDKVTAVLPLVLVFALLSASSGDPWDKDAAQWTDQDAQLVLSDSPWVQSVEAEMHDPRDDRDEYSAPPPAGERAGMAGQTNPVAPSGRWDGGTGRNSMGSLPSLPVTVRWDSALPVREALRRVSGSETPGASSGDYVITLTGLIPAGRYHSAGRADTSSNSDGVSDKRNPEELLEAFMSSSRLLPRGETAIAPSNVKLDPASGALHIFFPHTRPIEAKAKEVVFVTRFGDFRVRAKFRVKDMRYQGKPAL